MQEPHFSKWREFFWPVHRTELKKIIPMLAMFFCITFNYTILRDVKDALVITAPGSGAEVIPFLKVWGVVPSAILFMLIYAKLSNLLSRVQLFYATLFPFLLFFALFAFILYPHREFLHPEATATRLQEWLPQGMSGLVALYRNWTFALFYVLAEMWGTVMLTLVFWGFANQITHLSQAKRFYALLGIGGNAAPLFAGMVMVHFANQSQMGGEWHWETSLKVLMSCVIAAGIAIIGCYTWIQRIVLTDPQLTDRPQMAPKGKLKMSLKESMIFLSHSPYIRLLAVLVIAYGIAMNLIEVTWKHQAKLQFPNASDYGAFMGYISISIGILSPLMALFVGGLLIRKLGWKTSALITPIVLLVTGICFFIFILLKQQGAAFIQLLGTTPLMLAVIFGSIQNTLSRATKFSLFDPTKEMVYIPLDEESKVKGKAAVDVVGSRLGKSGGALVQQGLLMIFGTLEAITPYVGVLMFIVITAWISAVCRLGRHFDASHVRNS